MTTSHDPAVCPHCFGDHDGCLPSCPRCAAAAAAMGDAYEDATDAANAAGAVGDWTTVRETLASSILAGRNRKQGGAS